MLVDLEKHADSSISDVKHPHQKEDDQDIDSTSESFDALREKFLYLLAIEIFLLYMTYLHYPYLDKHNKFLTPVMMGSQTTLLAQSLTQYMLRKANLNMLFKFLTWGGINGLLSSVWIELLVDFFDDKRLLCVLLDQTIGTAVFQLLFVVFIHLWDGVGFKQNWWVMCWKLVKMSYMVWPWVSFLSFTYLSKQWIFPVNCGCNLIFGVMLSVMSV